MEDVASPPRIGGPSGSADRGTVRIQLDDINKKNKQAYGMEVRKKKKTKKECCIFMSEKRYAMTRKIGNTTVHVVAPPPISKEEKERILNEYHWAAWAIIDEMIERGEGHLVTQKK